MIRQMGNAWDRWYSIEWCWEIVYLKIGIVSLGAPFFHFLLQGHQKINLDFIEHRTASTYLKL